MDSILLRRLQDALGKSFRVERELSGGNMARVIVVHDTTLDRPLVLKMLDAETAAVLSAERFDREIRVAAKLQHPNIVPLVSAGVVDGLPYYTMPFVQGQSLRDVLRARGPLSIDEGVSLLCDVARALTYAHERDIVHRDIKPDNVLITSGTAVVTDFGIAKALNAASTPAAGHDATLTGTGLSLGTPAYMAPEQIVAGRDVDCRADLYSFGCMAYEVFTGHPPFQSHSAQDVLAAHLTAMAAPIERIRPDVPTRVASFIMRSLAKEPAERPSCADEFIAATRTNERPSAPRKRSIGLAAAAAAVAAALVVVHFLDGRSLVAAGRLRANESLVVADFTTRGTADTSLGAVLAEAVRADLNQSYTITVSPSSAVDETLKQMRLAPGTKIDERRAREVAQQQGARAFVAGDIVGVASSYIVTERLLGARSGDVLASYQATAESASGLVGAVQDVTRKMRHRIGESLRSVEASAPLEKVTTGSIDALRKYQEGVRADEELGDYETAVARLREAVTIDTAFGMAWRKLGVAYAHAGYPASFRQETRAHCIRHLDRLTDVDRLLSLAESYDRRAQRVAALDSLLRMRVHGDAREYYAGVHNLGTLELDRRHYVRAESLFRAVLSREIVPHTLRPLAEAYELDGQIRLADSVRNELARLFPNHPDVLLAGALRSYRQGNIDSAIAQAERVAQGEQAVAGLEAYDILASLELRRGSVVRARQARVARFHLNSDRGAADSFADALWNAEIDIWFQGQRDAGVRLLDSLATSNALRTRPRTEHIYTELACWYARAGRGDRARAMLQRMSRELPPEALESNEPWRHRALGEIALAESHPDAAVSEFRAADTLPDGPVYRSPLELYANLGRAFDATNNADSAVTYYQRYLSAPVPPDIRLKADVWYRSLVERGIAARRSRFQ